MNFKLTLLLVFISIIPSCLIQFVKGDGYEYLPDDQKNIILPPTSFGKVESGNIYEITGKDLKRELKNHNKALVYVFSSGCKGSDSDSLKRIERYSEENQLHLFLVLTSYTSLNKTLDQEIESPIYSINSKHYGDPTQSNYYKEFMSELGYYKYANDNINGSFIFFEKDSIFDIKKRLFNSKK